MSRSAKRKNSSPNLARPRVILFSAEDDGVLRELLGCTYSVQACAWDSTSTWDETTADIFILDLSNVRQALRTIRRIRRNPKTQNVPILLSCTPGAEELLARALENGATDFFRKPLHPSLLVARIENVLREAREKERLSTLAQIDDLTGLANFRALTARLHEEFTRANRYGYELAAVMIDLDYLKAVNDRFGHEIGNRALCAVAQCLKDNVREVDFVARYGGDEFVVLMAYQNPEDAAVFAQRLRGDLARVQVLSERGQPLALPLTVSIGIAGHGPSHRQGSAEDFFHRADTALYQAKRQGRDQAVIDSPTQDDEVAFGEEC